MGAFTKYKVSNLKDDIIDPCGWLDRDGRYYQVPNWGHDAFAQQYLENNDQDPGYMPANTLEESGWVHITHGHFIVPRNMSSSQKNAIYDWMMRTKSKAAFSDSPMSSKKNLNVHEFLDAYASQLTQQLLRLAQKSNKLNCPEVAKQLTAIASRFF